MTRKKKGRKTLRSGARVSYGGRAYRLAARLTSACGNAVLVHPDRKNCWLHVCPSEVTELMS